MSEMLKARGRPPMGPKSGKGNVLTTRITAETRAALEAEAERTGRSISQVAEIWIDAARKGRADYQSLLGGTQLAAGIEKLVELARTIDDAVAPELRHDAIVAAWGRALFHVVPRPFSSHDRAVATQMGNIRQACETALAAINDAPETDPVRIRLESPLDIHTSGTSLRESIVHEIDRHGRLAVRPALDALLAAGNTAQNGVHEAIQAIETLDQTIANFSARAGEARQLGRDIAEAHGFDHSVMVKEEGDL